MNTGTIVQVAGPVVDVEFPGALPAIYNALTVKDGTDQAITLEVQQHLGDRWVRAISMSGTEGLKRGQPVTDSGEPIHILRKIILRIGTKIDWLILKLH